MGPYIQNWPNMTLKWPKKAFVWPEKGHFSKSDPRLWTYEFFQWNKVPFVFYFDPFWAKHNFLEILSPKKHVSSFLPMMVVHRKLRLCLQNGVWDVSNWNQVQNIDLSDSRQGKFGLECGVVKNRKKFKKQPF